MNGPLTIDQLNMAIKQAIEVQIQREVDEGIKQLEEKIKSRRVEIASAVAIRVANGYDLYNDGRFVSIRIEAKDRR